MKKTKKVLLLGSGALKIGEAGEFDYSGSQAIRALKEEKVEIVLVNPNIATYQTSEGMADKVYFLPVTPHFVEKVIKKEKPDAIMLSFGGQTALNCGVELKKKGILEKYNVRVLGTQVSTIEKTEDRHLFANELKKINVKTAKSKAVHNVKEALQAASKIGYPVMVRAAFALGGKGSGVAKNKEELERLAKKAFSSLNQVLIEEYLKGWKEVEYEVVRDKKGNCITVCNMENFDPMGIHTGESIVVAPSQTLTNNEYHKLREISIKVIKHLKIVGECNIQFALDPNSDDYRVIEVNARLSRSSALASKATGYPLAFIAAKLALGYTMTELENSITKKTKAFFEPALDYIVVKIPRWDLHKFRKVSKNIGSEMKSVGEVMAIGRKFEEAVQKAIRMLYLGMHGLVSHEVELGDIMDTIKNPTDKRIFAIAEAIKRGTPIEEIKKLSGIDEWFLHKIENIVNIEKQIADNKLTKELLLEAKKLGFSDYQIGKLKNKTEQEIRKIRLKRNIKPVIKQIDTLAAEYPAVTNYLYLTYNGNQHDIKPTKEKSIAVLGSGPYSIGSSVEFDWCCVNSVSTAKRLGYKTIMINYNPETVSTDYDVCDKLYFDELSLERVLDICDFENPDGAIVSFGGQIPNSLALKLKKAKVNILGTSPEKIDNAENRHKFSKLLDQLEVDQPPWKELSSFDEAKQFCNEIGYPVLVRPSYVLSGAAMNVAFNHEDLIGYLTKASKVSQEYPVVISKFITNAREIEIDGVAQKGNLVVWAVTEHVENAGVHSGDATMVLPPQKTYIETIRRIKKIAKKIIDALEITGPFNIQFIAKENEIKVIECNLRSSRSFPFVSKVTKINFVELATKAILGEKISNNKTTLDLDYVGVKAPQFSFSRLRGADPTSSVEMTSTGEVACLGDDHKEAFLKSLLAAEFKLPEKKTVLVSIGGEKNRYRILDKMKSLKKMGYRMFATEHTSEFLNKNGIDCKRLYKVHEKKQPNVSDYIQNKKLGLIINVPDPHKQIRLDDTYTIRRGAIDYSIPLITNLQLADLFIDCLSTLKLEDLEIKSWREYR